MTDTLILGFVNQDGSVKLLGVAPNVNLLASGEFLAAGDGVVNLYDGNDFVSLLAG